MSNNAMSDDDVHAPSSEGLGSDELEEGSTTSSHEGAEEEETAGVQAQAGQLQPQPALHREATLPYDDKEEADAVLTYMQSGHKATGLESPVLELEVNELLAEARAQLSGPALATLDAEVAQLRKSLALMKPHEVLACNAAPGFVRELGLDPQATSLPFQPPLAVTAVGSTAARCSLAGPSPPSLDVAVVMPPACMFKKAFLNYRYHARRALYLSAVASHLRTSPPFSHRPMRLESCQHDPARPVLVLGLPHSTGQAATGNGAGSKRDGSSSSSSGVELRLLPCLPPSAFPLAKLAPDRNCVRAVQQARPASSAQQRQQQQQQGQQQHQGEQKPQKGQDAAEAALLPTPAYNAGIMADCCVLLHAALLQRTLLANPKLADGLLLLKVWARQHGLDASQTADGLDGHTMAMLMVHLAECGKLSLSMTPLQMLRAALHALSDPNSGLPKGIAMTSQSPEQLQAAVRAAAPTLLSLSSPSQHTHHHQHGNSAAAADALAHAACDALPPATTASPSIATFRRHAGALTSTSSSGSGGGAVLVDPSGHCNLAAHMGRASVAAVVAAARATLALLDGPADADEAVAAAFLTPASHVTAADYTWAVAVPDGAARAAKILRQQQQQQQQQQQADGGSNQARLQAAQDGEEGEAGWRGLCRDKSMWRDAEASVESIARTALTDRAPWVHAVRQPLQASPVEQLQRGLLRPRVPGAVLLQARLDPTLALRLLDVGPAADDAKAAAKFRAFWGDASELRRFQDGKISEAVVWPAAPGSRHTIPDRVLEYALSRHRPGRGPGTVLGCSSVLDPALCANSPTDAHLSALSGGSSLLTLTGSGVDTSAGFSGAEEADNTAVTSARLIEAALTKLGKQLRSLEGLVLKVVGVQPQSSAICQTSPCPPKPHPLAGATTSTAASAAGDGSASGGGGSHGRGKGKKGGKSGADLWASLEDGKLPRCLEPVEVMVQVENSGKWPSDLVAFKKMKAALGLQLAEALEKSYGLLTQASEDAVDVFADGFAFRLCLYSGRDEAMLARMASDMLTRPNSTSPATAAAHSTAPAAAAGASSGGSSGGVQAGQQGQGGGPHPASLAVSPESLPLIRNWHHGLIQAVGGANPAYAPTVRLAQRWLGAHLLSNHFAEEAVELLVAATFTCPSALPAPASRLTGFMRFLQLLARHPWSSRPLVVDPERQLSAAQRSELQRRFDERRGIGPQAAVAAALTAHGPLPAMFVCTPRDPGSSHWTHSRPGPDALAHTVALARRCYAALTTILERTSAETVAAAAPAAAASTPSAAAAAAAPAVRQLSQAAVEAAFSPRLEDFDLLLTLRPEALPRARNALAPPIAATAASLQQRKRRRQPDSLTMALEEEGPDKPPKRARAFLDAFPEKAMETRGPDALRAELLVGFDPLPQLLSALHERLGTAATAGGGSGASSGPVAALCVDGTAGHQVVGVKWAPAAFLPAPAKATSCHTALPCAATGLFGAGLPGSGRASAVPLAVPNVVQVVREMQQLGEGLVEDSFVVRSCSKLPR